MTNFQFALAQTLEREGVFSDHPQDTPTKYGITEAVAREFGYLGDMRDLPLSKAEEIYLHRYWIPLNLDAVDSKFIASEIFDSGVNLGIRFSAYIAQLSARILSGNQILIDGIIGPKSIKAINSLLPKYEKNLYVLLNVLQGLRYLGFQKYDFMRLLVNFESSPRRKVFIRGWMRRLSEFSSMAFGD